MKFFGLSLQISLQRRLFNRSTLILLLAFALLLAGCALLLQQEDIGIAVRVGLVFEAETALTDELLEQLRHDDVVTYEVLNLPRDQVEEMVATGDLECAFFFPRDLRTLVRSGNTEGAVELVTSPRSVLDSLARLRLFVALTECLSPDLALLELLPQSALSEAELEAFLAERFDFYQNDYTFVETQIAWRGGEDTRESLPPPLSPSRILHGIIALFLILVVVVSLPGLISEQDHLRHNLTPGRMAVYWLACILSVWLTALAAGLVGIAALRLVSPGLVPSFSQELSAILLYSGACAALGCLPALFLKGSDFLFSAGVFLILSCIVLGGVLVDPAELGGVLEPVSRFFLTTHYLNGILAGDKGALSLCGIAFLAALAAGCLLPFWRFRRVYRPKMRPQAKEARP